MARYYYRTPSEKRVACNMRLPRRLKASLQAIVRLWQLIAESEGHNPDAVDLTFVCERLLAIGAEGVWVQATPTIGHEGVPRSEGSWDKIKESLRHRPKTSLKKIR